MKSSNILITGGAGFIGSHVVKCFTADERYNVFNLDKLTYSGNLNNLTEIEARNKGKVRSEGRDYIVEDGDVITFRFNV